MLKGLLIVVSLVCNSEADMGMECSESQKTINTVKTLICESDLKFGQCSEPIVAYYQWHQGYEGPINQKISILSSIRAFNSRLKITLEKFDNNTSIYASFYAYKGSDPMELISHLTIYCSGVENKIIRLDDSYNRYEIDNILSYGDSKSIKFSCEHHSRISNNVQVGWINPAGDQYFPYNHTNIIITPTEQHNGSILCCLFYTVISPDVNMFVVERIVKDKTMLMVRRDTPDSNNVCLLSTTTIKNSSDNSNVLKTSNTDVNSNNTKATDSFEHTTDRIKNTTTMTGDKEHNKNATRVVPDATKATESEENTTNTTDSKRDNANERDEHSDTTNKSGNLRGDEHALYYVTIGLSISATVLIVAIILYVLWRRYWKKKTRPRYPLPLPQIPRLQSPNEPIITTPFYVNLLFRRECEKEIEAQEEPEYDEIMYH